MFVYPFKAVNPETEMDASFPSFVFVAVCRYAN